MSRANRIWILVIIVSTIGVALTLVDDRATPVRAGLAFWFLLICPGMAYIHLLHLNDLLLELAFAVALSLVFDTILVIGMIYSGLWSPPGALVVLIGLTLIGLFIQLISAIWRVYCGWVRAALFSIVQKRSSNQSKV